MDERATTVDSEELLAHAGWVRELARRLARDHASAEDLVQETWLTALRTPPRNGPDLRGWLTRVLTSSARRRARTDRRRLDRELRARRAGEDADVAELVVAVEEQQRIGRVVLQLAEPYRSVILRHYWRGETPAQIARHTGRSPATVRSQLSRARAELRAALALHHGGDSRAVRAGLLAAAGPPSLPWLTPIVQGALIVKQSEKLAWVAAAGLAVAFVAVGWNAWNLGSGPAATMDSAAEAELLALDHEPPMDEAPVASVPEAPDARRAVSPPAEPAPPEATPTPTRVVGRFIDNAGRPVADATLRPREGPDAAASDADGRVRLVVPDSALRTWNDRRMPTSFVAERDGYATRFLLATPARGEDTDLGDLVLEPGGSLAGVVVDGANEPLDGVRVLATGVELGAPIETLRSQGPETWQTPDFPDCESDHGEFVVHGVPAGDARLWARAEGTGWVISEPIAVRPRSQTGGLRIVLKALSSEDLIRGVVRDPAGAPVPDAYVTYQFPSITSASRHTSTGEDGRFEIVAEVREPHDLCVEVPDSLMRPAVVRGVLPGGDEVTITLATARWMRVAAIDAETHDPLAEPWMYTTGEDHLEYDPRAAREADELGPGERFVRIPQERFTLHVRKDGYERYEAGPFEPAGAPEELAAWLAPLAGVSGRVTLEGAPVEGAKVALLRAVLPNMLATSYGFRMRMDPFGDASVETGPDGRYSLGASKAGEYFLLVTKAGLAVGERGPIDVDPAQDLTDIDVALVHGGAIEGVVLVPPGRDPAGNIVSASRGDGDVRFARTDADGFYRFERLSPGGWQVAHRDREAQLSISFRSFDGPKPPIEWDCEVVDGGTTRHDVDLRGTTQGLLRGRLVLDGAGAFGWSATLVREVGADVLAPVRSVALAADGSFELRGAKGDWRLQLQSPVEADPAVTVSAALTLGDVPVDWGAELATGTLTGTSHLGDAELRFSWCDEHGTGCLAAFTPAADGAFRVTVLAGSGKLARLQPVEHSPVAVGWQDLRDVEVLPGAILDVDLP